MAKVTNIAATLNGIRPLIVAWDKAKADVAAMAALSLRMPAASLDDAKAKAQPMNDLMRMVAEIKEMFRG